MAGSNVALLKTAPDTILDDIERLADLAGMSGALDRSAPTILKDNISWHLPFLSANTTPWQLEGAIKALQGAGFEDLTAIHNDTVVTNAYKGGRLNKLDGIYRKYDIPEKYNFLGRDIDWIKYEPKAGMRVLNRIFPKGIYLPDFFFNKNIVHLPTMKTHIYTTTTGSMKNAFGGLLNTKRHYTHSVIHETLVDLLAIQREIHPGIFTFMDGTMAGSGPGPRTMIPHEKDFILASSDPVAIDAVAAKMMGFEPMEIDYIRLAHEAGLGTGRFEEIEIRGFDPADVNFNFSVGNNLVSFGGSLFWFGPLRSIQKLLFHTPLVYLFIFGSFFYHDFVWWPIKGKPLMKKVVRETKWGRLFDSYPG